MSHHAYNTTEQDDGAQAEAAPTRIQSADNTNVWGNQMQNDAHGSDGTWQADTPSSDSRAFLTEKVCAKTREFCARRPMKLLELLDVFLDGVVVQPDLLEGIVAEMARWVPGLVRRGRTGRASQV